LWQLEVGVELASSIRMAHSLVVCSDCGDVNAAIEWGFVLLARHGWSAQLGEIGRDPQWRCPACNAKLSDPETWDETMDEPPATARRLRVLLIDDQEMVLRATATMLRELDLVTAGSGAEALAKLADGSHFDVIVSDVTMPGMGGAELYVRIRKQYPPLAERVLLISGDAYGAEQLCAHVGRREGIPSMPRVLHKPVPRDELVRAIEALGRSSLPRSGTFAVAADAETQRSKAK
jgi:CheY-like chemotaxis protein